MGHQDTFLRPRLSARYRFSQGTFARTRGNGQDAPESDDRGFLQMTLARSLYVVSMRLDEIDERSQRGW